jgi:hypothetical protein
MSERFEIPVFADAVPVVPETPAAPVVPEVPAPAEGGEPVQNKEEQAPPAEPEGEKPEVITPEQAAKREGRRFGRKLDAAYKRAAEEKARADFLDKQLKELTPKTPTAIGSPRLEDFSDIETYATAKGKFEREQGIKEYEATQQASQAKQVQERLVSDWEVKADRGEEKYDDFAEVVGDLKPVNSLVAAIMQADNAEDVAYYLGKHRDEATQIGTLDPVAQIRAIGKLEAKLLAEPPKPKTPSKAPAPIVPLEGTSGASSQIPSEQDDMETWIRKRSKQVHG